MKTTKWRIATILIFPLLVLALFSCEGGAFPYTPGALTTPQPAYSAAQATLDFGLSQMRDLNNRATAVGLQMAQAADAAAQSTQDVNQRRAMELSFQSTLISQNMAQAAATLQFITEQTQMAQNATVTSQSQEATATYSTYLLNVTQTAQAYAILSVQATETAQAYAAFTSYSLTATPLAAIQASNAQTQQRDDRRAFWEEVVVKPMNLFLSTLVILLLILGGVLAYRRLMPVLELRLRTISSSSGDHPFILIDGISRVTAPLKRRMIPPGLSRANLFRFVRNGTIQVEIISPFDPYVAGWIEEAEQKLRDTGVNTP